MATPVQKPAKYILWHTPVFLIFFYDWFVVRSLLKDLVKTVEKKKMLEQYFFLGRV